MIRPILRMGEPSLMQPSANIERFNTAELHTLLDDLRDTMQAANGAGIAAPLKRIAPGGKVTRRVSPK